MDNRRPHTGEARSKIVATVGPACESVEMLEALVRAGVDVFRINAGHGKQADFERILGRIRQVREKTGFQVATLLDLSGPKIRLGKLAVDPLEITTDMKLSFVRGDQSEAPDELCCNYPKLLDEVSVGDRLILADGTVALEVTSVRKDRCECRALGNGTIRSRQGVNLPGIRLSVSTMRPEDIENAIWGAKNEIDFISLSFVRSPEDVTSLKSLIASLDSTALVVAKIEKREALDRLEEIVEVADIVMVARGDLGVEIDVAETPVAQKRIIDVCRQKMKPVIVATQMLESMHQNRRPTRAEASDVANAILDGADACMLSGETAIGHYPVDAVETMNRIMLCTESILPQGSCQPPVVSSERVHPITSAVTFYAASIAQSIDAKLVVIASHTGGTAWVKSKQRNAILTLGISDSTATLRRMCLFWGIMPYYVPCLDDTQTIIDEVTKWGRSKDILAAGDRIVFVTGTGVINNTHNWLVVHEVPRG